MLADVDLGTGGFVVTTRNVRPGDTLLELATELGGEHVDHHPDYVAFDLGNAQIEGMVKDGAARLNVLAHLGTDEPSLVEAWVARQPQPRSGVLDVITVDDGSGEPVLVFERPIAGNDWSTDPMLPDIRDYSAAWRDDAVDTTSAIERDSFVVHHDPRDGAPSSGWLLMGDTASFPRPDELAVRREVGRVGIFDLHWTAAKQTLVGDLVLVYFMAPRKAVHFVARAASNAFFSREIAVNAEGPVADEQRWAYLTPLIEIEPIPFKSLQAAAGGHLILKGHSGKYLRPDTLEALTIRPKDPEDQAELDRIWKIPVGLADLPRPENVNLKAWRMIAPGALPLESHVSSHIVEPLLRLLLGETSLTWSRERRVRRGSVDFVVLDQGAPTVAIEVKLATVEPPGGDWSKSRDFNQLRRYMDELAVPGILVDAHRVLLVEHSTDQPYRDIARRSASGEEIEAIRKPPPQPLRRGRRRVTGMPADRRRVRSCFNSSARGGSVIAGLRRRPDPHVRGPLCCSGLRDPAVRQARSAPVLPAPTASEKYLGPAVNRPILESGMLAVPRRPLRVYDPHPRR